MAGGWGAGAAVSSASSGHVLVFGAPPASNFPHTEAPKLPARGLSGGPPWNRGCAANSLERVAL